MELSVDKDFGIFAPLLRRGTAYLALLNFSGANVIETVVLVNECCSLLSNPYPDICLLLRQPNWRPHVVAAVAVAELPYDAETGHALWAAFDAGSWVAPQLAAAAFLRDPGFADRACERLRSGCAVDLSQSSGFSEPERHSATGPGGSFERSAKNAATLVRLVGMLPQEPEWRTDATGFANVMSLAAKDIDRSGQIAEEWLRTLTKILAHLGMR